jgi:tape measure domain-containing protein
MANAASTIEIELEIRDAINRLGKLEGELKKSSSAMDRVANSTNKMESAFKSARNAASALFAAISVQQIAQAADTFTRFANQIRIATTSAAEAAAVQKELYRVSQTTGTAIEDTTKLYSRLRIAADQLGSSQAETIRLTDIVAKSLAAAGTSSTEASGALLQLAQALNSPKVQAEEFNSLIDGMPNLLREVEKQLGLTAGSLKKFVTDGNLTNQLFKDAILGSADAINEQFGAAQDTIATSFTRLNNAFILLVGNFEKSTGFFNSIASVISTLAENMDELARVLKAVAVGFTIAFAPKVIRAIYDTATAMKALGAASKTNVIGALAALGFYIADVTGGLDSLMEKLGLTKDKADETAGAIVDLTKGGGGAGASQSKTFESAFFQETIKSLEGYLTDIEKYGPQLTEEINKILFDVNRLLDEDPEFVSQTIFGSDELLPLQQYITELSKIVEIVEAAIKAQRDYNQLKTKDAQITEEGAALEQKILDAKFAINKAQEELNALQKIDIYDGILNSLRRFLGIQQDITDETEKQLSNAEKQAKAREQYVNTVGDTIVGGVFGAGPNASRAGQAAQAYGAAGGVIPGLINAATSAVLSNEKVAAAIDEQFAILFDTIDPLIDVLADLQSAINRLIAALAKGIGDGIQSVLDQAGVGQDSYLFGGGFASDFEQFSFDISGGMFGVNNRPTGMSAEEYSSFSLGLWQRTSADAVAELLQDVGNVGFSSIMEGVESEYEKVVERIQSMSGDDVTDEQRSQLLKNAAAANESLINRLNQQFRAMSNDKTVELLKEINERGIERNRIDQIRIDYTKEINQVSEDLSLTEEDQTKVINALIKARDREIESIERQQQLLQLQSVQSDLQSLFTDFENTIEAISELVQSLFDQVNDLLFSEFNLAGPQEAFALAQGTYESLLANAFDPDATEEDIKALQGFVNDYLSAARDVFKSSTAFTTIFEGVLSDLALLGTQYGFNAPIAAASTLSSGAEDLLGDLPEELQTAVSDLISGINLATLAFAQQQVEFLTTVYQIPIELKAGNFIVDTSGVNKSINLNSSNFSLDSSRLNLSLLMSSSMFTVNTSGLNFGTITPTATAGRPNLGTIYPIVSLGTPNLGKITPAVSPGIPNLGVITPTLTLDTSNITSSLSSLSTIINDAFSLMIGAVQLQATILEAQASNITGTRSGGTPINILMKYGQVLTGQAAEGSIGVDMNTDIDYGEGWAPGVTSASNLTPDQQFASIYNKLPETAPYLLNRPYYVLMSAAGSEYSPRLAAFDEIEEARSFYNYMSTTTGLYGWDAPVFKYGFRRGGIVDPMDTIPAMLSPGEYILSPETVRRYGVSNLNRLNSGDSAAINATSDPEVKRLLAELIVAVRENDTEVNVYTDMAGQTKAGIEEFRSELRERTRRQGDKFLPARYI